MMNHGKAVPALETVKISMISRLYRIKFCLWRMCLKFYIALEFWNLCSRSEGCIIYHRLSDIAPKRKVSNSRNIKEFLRSKK